ncbi:HTH-type transcriptional repressor NicR [compost metagenome]
MDYEFLIELLGLARRFEDAGHRLNTKSIGDFNNWVIENRDIKIDIQTDFDYPGKENGRTPQSVINTMLVQMVRYAKTYSKSAIDGSDFSTQDEFSYLITLRAFGAMSKIELVRKNVHDKPTGIQIINRLIKNGWVSQYVSQGDRRSRMVTITDKGLATLDKQMEKIRLASQIVTANLDLTEQMELIRLLSKLEAFHRPIYDMQLDSSILLSKAAEHLKKIQN